MKAEAAERRFVRFLKSKKQRVTRQRLEVLRLSWETHEHFTAEGMLTWARKLDQTVSRATVYRSLALLVEGGFLSVLERGKESSLYEHSLGHAHHDHMVCLSCETIIEFQCEAIEELQRLEAKKRSFNLVDHSLTLEGYCSQCKNPAR
ncbi:MAG: Fur family transcriptional regulator [Planctomycetota bacterium]|jgi:Fur family ferric uptake transcriptional regulator|nr:Fur family transcriptional regulator [Planctomycetota bacterium]